MVLADEKTPIETKLAIILNAYHCTGCSKVFNQVECCELKKDLDRISFEPLDLRVKGKCRYYIKK